MEQAVRFKVPDSFFESSPGRNIAESLEVISAAFLLYGKVCGGVDSDRRHVRGLIRPKLSFWVAAVNYRADESEAERMLARMTNATGAAGTDELIRERTSICRVSGEI